jgi:hypothetical protein
MQAGNMLQRRTWLCEDKFIFMQVPSTISSDIVPKMQSLPQQVKDEFNHRFNDRGRQIDSICYSNQIAIVNTSNLITGYSPSLEDTLADDWIVKMPPSEESQTKFAKYDHIETSDH